MENLEKEARTSSEGGVQRGETMHPPEEREDTKLEGGRREIVLNTSKEWYDNVRQALNGCDLGTHN